ncbi:MAG: metallophosphoesterase [Lachnospiraceae bacterium]|nr:metallophosphoesterase [Lachnospiraceae bacterium]
MTFVYVLLILIICFMAYSVTESLRFKVTDYCVKSKKVPASLAGKRIALLADLHCTHYGKGNERLYSRLKDPAPDIIIIAGDLVDGLSEDEFKYAAEFLTGLKRLGIPVYYAYGNHETKFTLRENNLYDRYASVVKETGCELLRDRKADIYDGVSLYGLELKLGHYNAKYEPDRGAPDVKELLGAPDERRYNILIAHTPEYEKQYYEWGADLVLSGHVHGGLFRLPFIGGVISPRFRLFPHYDRGVYTDGEHTMILSAGLGWHGFPFRFNNLPEIVNITLEKEE